MRVQSVQVVTAFKENKNIMFSAGQALVKLERQLSATLKMLDVPRIAPPEAPRALLQREDSVIGIAFNRLDMTAFPPAHINGNFVNALNFAFRSFVPVIQALFESALQYDWAGIIVTVQYPNGILPANEAVTSIFDRMINVERGQRPLANFTLQFAYNEDDLYKGYSVSGFETKEFSLERTARVGEAIAINLGKLDLDKFPIIESGMQILVDINNKPAKVKLKPRQDVQRIIDEHIKTFEKLPVELNLEGFNL